MCHILHVLLLQLSSKVTSLGDMSNASDGTENLNREVSQLRERLTELDRALMAVSSMVTANMKEDHLEDEPDAGPVDQEEMKRVKSALHRVQQENERLLGTAAHISHEMEVNKEHIKVKGQHWVRLVCSEWVDIQEYIGVRIIAHIEDLLIGAGISLYYYLHRSV